MDLSLLLKRSLKKCPEVGRNNDERRENQVFPSDRIMIRTDYLSAAIPSNLEKNTTDRLNYLGFSKHVSPPSSAGGGTNDYYYEQDVSKMVTGLHLQTVKVLSHVPEMNDSDDE